MLDPIKNPELFVGFVCPIGVRLPIVIRETKEAFESLGYTCVHIKLSTVIKNIPRYSKLPIDDFNELERLECLMAAGDHLRSSTQRADAVVMAALAAIQLEREKITDDPLMPAARVVYLIDSIKHPQEIVLLRALYGKLFFCFSVFDTRTNRVTSLAERLSDSTNKYEPVLSRSSAEELIEKDFNSKGSTAGQNVRDAFPMSDAFLRIQDSAEVRNTVQRILEIWFGHPFHTPTMDEYGMYIAKAAALRSADLSRQVGAAILSDPGEVIALGCNEVPHPTGRLVWPGTSPDKRDFRVGFDSTAKMKIKLIAEVIHRLILNNYLNSPESQTPEQLALDLLSGDHKTVLQGTRAASLIEFGRVVHAEMTAITECARRGLSTSGHTLFSTTYPCHICARHIIACGIKRVVYIEPYAKSMAKDLYGDLLTVDDLPRENTVNFQPFEGLGPLRYGELFEMGAKSRKDAIRGDAITWKGASACPMVEFRQGSYTESEEIVLGSVSEESKRFGFHQNNDQHPFLWETQPKKCTTVSKSVAPSSQGELKRKKKQPGHSFRPSPKGRRSTSSPMRKN